MSKKVKAKRSDRTRKPKSRKPVEVTSGIIDRGIFGEGDSPLESKIVFLGEENLDRLRGYKAFLDLWPDGEVCLTLTGLSRRSGQVLFNSLEKMRDEEVHGE